MGKGVWRGQNHRDIDCAGDREKERQKFREGQSCSVKDKIEG